MLMVPPACFSLTQVAMHPSRSFNYSATILESSLAAAARAPLPPSPPESEASEPAGGEEGPGATLHQELVQQQQQREPEREQGQVEARAQPEGPTSPWQLMSATCTLGCVQLIALFVRPHDGLDDGGAGGDGQLGYQQVLRRKGSGRVYGPAQMVEKALKAYQQAGAFKELEDVIVYTSSSAGPPALPRTAPTPRPSVTPYPTHHEPHILGAQSSTHVVQQAQPPGHASPTKALHPATTGQASADPLPCAESAGHTSASSGGGGSGGGTPTNQPYGGSSNPGSGGRPPPPSSGQWQHSPGARPSGSGSGTPTGQGSGGRRRRPAEAAAAGPPASGCWVALLPTTPLVRLAAAPVLPGHPNHLFAVQASLQLVCCCSCHAHAAGSSGSHSSCPVRKLWAQQEGGIVPSARLVLVGSGRSAAQGLGVQDAAALLVQAQANQSVTGAAAAFGQGLRHQQQPSSPVQHAAHVLLDVELPLPPEPRFAERGQAPVVSTHPLTGRAMLPISHPLMLQAQGLGRSLCSLTCYLLACSQAPLLQEQLLSQGGPLPWPSPSRHIDRLVAHCTALLDMGNPLTTLISNELQGLWRVMVQSMLHGSRPSGRSLALAMAHAWAYHMQPLLADIAVMLLFPSPLDFAQPAPGFSHPSSAAMYEQQQSSDLSQYQSHSLRGAWHDTAAHVLVFLSGRGLEVTGRELLEGLISGNADQEQLLDAIRRCQEMAARQQPWQQEQYVQEEQQQQQQYGQGQAPGLQVQEEQGEQRGSRGQWEEQEGVERGGKLAAPRGEAPAGPPSPGAVPQAEPVATPASKAPAVLARARAISYGARSAAATTARRGRGVARMLGRLLLTAVLGFGRMPPIKAAGLEKAGSGKGEAASPAPSPVGSPQAQGPGLRRRRQKKKGVQQGQDMLSAGLGSKVQDGQGAEAEYVQWKHQWLAQRWDIWVVFPARLLIPSILTLVARRQGVSQAFLAFLWAQHVSSPT